MSIEDPSNLVVVNCNDPKERTFFIEGEVIHYEEDEKVEYKGYRFPLNEELKTNLQKQICGFLNNKGGRIYIGISDDRKVIGCHLEPKARDIQRLLIINLTRDFYPKCRNDNIRISMIPVKTEDGNFTPHKYVVKIIVKKGDVDKLYSVSDKLYKSFKRLQGQCVLLTSIEIEKEIITRSRLKPIVDEFNEFDDREPEVVFYKENLNNFNVENKTRFSANSNEEIKHLISDLKSTTQEDLICINNKKRSFLNSQKENAFGSDTPITVTIWNLPDDFTNDQLYSLIKDLPIAIDKSVRASIVRDKIWKVCYAKFRILSLSDAMLLKKALSTSNINNKKLTITW